MKLPALVRRRQVWLPTALGALVLLAACAALVVAAGRHAHAFLAPTQPSGARVLVVEGWMPARELEQAPELIRSGGYERVVTSGGPMEAELEPGGPESYAERARIWLLRYGVPAEKVASAPAPTADHERTYGNALAVRDWLARNAPEVDAIDVFSSGAHCRRSWLLYREAFGSTVRVGIVAARPMEYDPERWWRTSAGTKTVLEELIAWLWTELFFWPGANPASR